MNVNIPQLADTLFERTTNTSWVVVFKSLTTTHHLMVYGNEVRAGTQRFCSLRKTHHQICFCMPTLCTHHVMLWADWAQSKTPLPLLLFPCRDLYSIWLRGTHYSTWVIFWTKVAFRVRLPLDHFKFSATCPSVKRRAVTHLLSVSVQATICQRSSGGTAATSTRRLCPTDKLPLTSLK